MSKRIPILIGLILLVIALWAQITTFHPVQHFVNRLESMAYDVQLRTKLFTQREPFATSIAIVDIDDKTLSRAGRWPWPRTKLAALVTQLQQEGAVVIALDMLFPDKEENIVDLITTELNKTKLATPQITPTLAKLRPLFDSDSLFAASLKQVDGVIGVSFLPGTLHQGQLPLPLLTLTTPQEKNLALLPTQGYISNQPIIQEAAKGGGFINVYPDLDGIIRRVPLLIRYKDNVYPSLALEAVRLYLLGSIKMLTASYGNTIRLEGVQVGSHIVTTDEQGQVIIPFRGKAFTFPYYSAIDVLNKTTPPDALQGKIVFLGTSATGLGDLPATAAQGAFPGVEIQATIADGILSDNFAYKPAWALGAEVFITFLVGIVIAILFPYLGPKILSLLVIVIPFLLMFGNNWIWEKYGLIISVFVPIALTVILGIMNIIYGYLFESRRRERLKAIFGQYVPPKHIDEMLQSKSDYGMHGEERDMTVLFADIRHFTSISEHLPASQIKELLNEFFTPMTEIIFKYQGTIDKYVGDLIMAFWGAPLKDKRHAQHAICAALDMQKMVKKLYPMLQEHKWPEINIGIGINSGMMSVGDMGSKFRRNYTVLGDAVNLASRAEGLTKFYGAPIIVTEYTAKNQKKFIFRQLDLVRVKGKENGITLYEVLCRSNEATPEILQEVELMDRALHYYFNREWDQASGIFLQLKSTHPNSKLYELYLERIAQYKEVEPDEDWNGIFSHTLK